MRGLLYLHLTGTKNRIRRSLKKAGTWVFLCLMGLYAFLMLPGLGKIIRETGLDRPEYFVLFLTAIQLYFGPANYAAYAKKKGLLFLPCDVQMVFPAPVSPKLPLLHACVRTQISNIFISLLLIPAGVFWFHAGEGEMILFALFSILESGAMEVCLVICLYGNERFSERTNRAFGRLMYLMIGCFLVMGAGMIWKNGMSWQTVLEFLSGKWIQMIPILGWEIGVYRLLFLGPELLSVTAALLYLLALLALFILAYRMKCSGQYYEDAMKFADDYQEARNRAKKGQAKSSAKKRPLRRTFVKYRGGGAKAVFYRQYLEAKKSRGFLFGSRTVWALFVAVFVTWMICREGSVLETLRNMGDFRFYVIPLGLLYYIILFSGQQNRWSKERENPYIFLIPDRPFKKLWYATLMEHVVNAVNGGIIIVPLSIVLRLPLWYLLIYLPFFVAMGAVKLYADVICETYLGSVPSYGRSLLKLFLSLTAVLLAVPVIAALHVLAGPAVGLAVGILAECLAAALLMLAGSRSFSRMEAAE